MREVYTLTTLVIMDEGVLTLDGAAKGMADVVWKSGKTWTQIKTTNPNTPTHAYIAVENANVRVWDKGDTSPSASDGVLYYAGTPISYMLADYTHYTIIDNLEFIQVSGTAKLSIEIYNAAPTEENYCTAAEVRAELGIKSNDQDAIIESMCSEVTGWIDGYCHRTFSILAETRYFDGDRELIVKDLIDITTLKIDQDGDGTFETTLASTDYILYPLNVSPKHKITVSHNGSYSAFAFGIRRGVEIVGNWGYSSVPDPVRRAAKIQVCRLHSRKQAGFALFSYTTELGQTQIVKGLDQDVKQMLDDFIRTEIK